MVMTLQQKQIIQDIFTEMFPGEFYQKWNRSFKRVIKEKKFTSAQAYVTGLLHALIDYPSSTTPKLQLDDPTVKSWHVRLGFTEDEFELLLRAYKDCGSCARARGRNVPASWYSSLQ